MTDTRFQFPVLASGEVYFSHNYLHRADSRLAPSQWETALLCNISHWLGTKLESALFTWTYVEMFCFNVCNYSYFLIWQKLYHHHKDLHSCHFPDNIIKCIFLNENIWISIEISLKFVPRGPINNIPAFIQIMAWRRPGNKPLSESMMVSLLTHICVTWPQWVNSLAQGRFEWDFR